MLRRPVEPGEDPGERAGEIGHAVGDDRQAEPSETLRVAVGVEDQLRDLRTDALDHPFEQRPPADRTQALVAAAHPPRLAAGQQQANDIHPASSPTLALRESRAGSSPTERGSPSKTIRSVPASATKRLPLARPTRVRPACRASSTPQAVKPERDTRIGIPIWT